MIDYVYADLFKKSSIDKQIKIEYDGGQFTNTDIPDNDFEITEMLCSESNLVFGSCETNSVKFTIANHGTSLVGKWLTISTVLSGNSNYPFYLGKYKVFSDKPSADRVFREIVAYDAMYDVLNADVTDWYNSLAFPMTLKQFRDSFFDYLGIVQVFTDLPLDNLTIEKTITADILVGKDVVNAICELNGRFGNINRYGKFKYIKLETISTGLYPSDTLFPSDTLYPRDKISFVDELYTGDYISCDYEDWSTNAITGLSILTKENDIGVSVGTDTNRYTITGNFLIYGKNEDELTGIANVILNEINDVSYQPFVAEKQGNPCVEVGDAVKFTTNKNEIVKSYVLERTMRGIQSITDSISAKGTKEIENNQNSLNSKVAALFGKSNVLERNIDETVSKISDVEQGLKSEIKQTADEITQNVSETYETIQSASETKSTLESQIKQTSESITSTVSKQITETKQYADNVASNAETNAKNDTTEKLKSYSTTTEMNSAIEQTAESITSAVAETYETKTDASATKKELSSQIEQTADNITQTVASSQSKWSTVTSDGAIIPISEYGYGLDGTITGSSYIFSDTLNVGDIYLDQETGYGWECTSISSIDEKRVALFGYRPKHTFSLITDELSSRIEQTISSISLEINNGDKTAGIVIALENEDGTTSEVTGTIEMTGTVTFNDLKGNGTTVINGSNITTGTIDAEKVNVINVVAKSVAAENITGTTISGKTIEGGTIYGAKVTTDGALKMLFPTTGERIVIEPQSPAVGDGIVFPLACYFNAYVKFSNINSTGGYNVSGNNGLYSSDMSANICRKNVVSNEACSQLGNNSHNTRIYGTNIYKGSTSTAITSDKRLKNCICSIENRYDDLFMKLNPVTFKMKNGESGRLHIGFIAQDIRDALNKCNISTEDFAGYVEDSVDEEYLKEAFGIDVSNEKDWSDGKQLYVRYEEFIALNTHMIQKQHKEIEQLKSEITELKEMVKALMQ